MRSNLGYLADLPHKAGAVFERWDHTCFHSRNADDDLAAGHQTLRRRPCRTHHLTAHSHGWRISVLVTQECVPRSWAAMRVHDSDKAIHDLEDGPGREKRVATAAPRCAGRCVVVGYVASFLTHYTRNGDEYQSGASELVGKS